RQKQKKLIMLPSETMIWQPEFTDKTLSRKPGAVQVAIASASLQYLLSQTFKCPWPTLIVTLSWLLCLSFS
ncbi:hypothetical protein ODR22_28880, partial [Escherichia coli]|nr:hypothetical protein [Escherichia coli]